MTELYPTADVAFYGHAVWPLGEGGEDGVMVAGHGRRAYAALNAHQRGEDGPHWRRRTLFQDRYRPGRRPPLAVADWWVTFHETCGCTDAEHATHLADDMHDIAGCPCVHDGLPPCEPNMYAWAYDRVPADDPGALPVIEVRW